MSGVCVRMAVSSIREMHMRKMWPILLAIVMVAGCYGQKENVITADEHAWMSTIEDGFYVDFSRNEYKVARDDVTRTYTAVQKDRKILWMLRSAQLSTRTYLMQYWSPGEKGSVIDVFAVVEPGMVTYMPSSESGVRRVLRQYDVLDDENNIVGPLYRVKQAMREYSNSLKGADVREILFNKKRYGKKLKERGFRRAVKERHGTWKGNI